MHELSVALSILDVAAEEAGRQGNVRVTAIHLRLGPLAGVIKEALLSAFEIARETSHLNEALLLIEEVPITVHCERCGGVQPVASPQALICAACGTPAVRILSGQELELTALEVVDLPDEKLLIADCETKDDTSNTAGGSPHEDPQGE